ncbi:MAG: putative manganese transporter [Acidobacteriota bacterium]
MLDIAGLLKESLTIVALVFVMMVVVDYINVATKGKLKGLLKGGQWRQYVTSSLLGAAPGCAGSFMTVSLYVHGLISFGAIVGGMIATSGDEAFVMLSLFPREALMLFGLLFILGLFFSWLTDKLVPQFKFKPSPECPLHEFHPEKESLKHYLTKHIWSHIIKQHLIRVFLWTFVVLFALEVTLNYWNLEAFIKTHLVWMLLISGLVGILPESGPHLIFVMMFARGVIPFSVLFTSSFVQDGHGLLPLLSYTVKDSIIIKLFNLAFGLLVGFIFYSFGW